MPPKREVILEAHDWALVYEALKQQADDLGDEVLDDIAEAIRSQSR